MSGIAKRLLQSGEGRSIEFKASVSPKSETYLKTVIAFANCAGGSILFGIDDKTHSVLGLQDDVVFKTQDAITNAICDRCTPLVPFNIEVDEIDGRTVLRLDVSEGRQKPYFLKSEGREKGTYVRIAATSRHADPWQLQQLEYACRPLTYDQTPLSRQVSAREVDELCLRLNKHASDLARNSDKNPPRPIGRNQLLSFGVMLEVNDHFFATPALELLSGRLADFPEAIIRCAVFRGESNAMLISKKECTGPIDEQIEEAYSFLLSNLRLGVRVEGLAREEFLELPARSVREMIANAVCHRSYLYPAPIMAALYADRLEVASPGMLAAGLSIEKMKAGRSQIHNRAIASVFRSMGLIENWGTGIPSLIEDSEAYGLGEPVLTEDNEYFKVILRRRDFEMDDHGAINPVRQKPDSPHSESFASVAVDAPSVKKPVNSVEAVLTLIRKLPSATQAEVAKELQMSLVTVKRAFRELLRTNRLRRVGNNRTGHWEVIA